MRKIICFLFFVRFVHAEISWSPIEELAHPGVMYHDITTDSKGNSYAVWVREDQNNFILETAAKYFQGKWESPIVLSKFPKEGTTALPAMIVDSSDSVHLLWVENTGDDYFLKTAVRRPNEKWLSSEVITSDRTVFLNIRLAKNSFGYVFAAWNKKFSKKDSIIQTAEKEAGKPWSEPINLTPLGYYGYTDIGADDLRNVYVIWTSFEAGEAYVQTSQRLSSNSWSVPSDFDRPGLLWGNYRKQGMETRLAVNSAGDAFGLSNFPASSTVYRVFCSYKNAGSSWTESRHISGKAFTDRGWIYSPDIVIDSLGNAFSAWYTYVPSFFSGIQRIEVVNCSKSNGWSDPRALIESSTNLYPPKIAVDNLGNAVVVWYAKTPSDCTVQASFFSQNQGWSQPLDVSCKDPSLKTNPKVIIDNIRRVHISWLEGPQNQEVIKTITAVFD